MFGKNPVRVEIEAREIHVDHRISVNRTSTVLVNNLATEIGKTAMKVIVVGIAAKTASEVLTHVVKTKIK